MSHTPRAPEHPDSSARNRDRASIAVLPGLRPQPGIPARFAERVYDSLFHSIMTGKLAPRSRLPSELELAGLFGVSRPVVRQALERLRKECLVRSVRGSGTYVRAETDPMPAVPLARTATAMRHFFEGLELRLIIEPESAYLAALRRTREDLQRMEQTLAGFEHASARGDVAHHFDYGFHEAIAQATSNPRIVQVLKSLEYDVSHAVSLWRHLARMKPSHRLQAALDEHRQLLQFIESRDPDSARQAMRGHLENARIRLLEVDPES